MSTQRLPGDDRSSAPTEQIDDGATPNRTELPTQRAELPAVLAPPAAAPVNPMVTNAPTVRGTDPNRILAEAEAEPRDLEIAKQVAVRLMGLGGMAHVDESDPIVGRKVLETIVVVRRLGEGGFGAVYLAVDTQEGMHDQKHALKVLLKDASGEDRERFKREISAAARAKSKRVVRVEKHGQFRDGRQWMLMEHVDGVSLDEELRQNGPCSVEKALGQIGLRLVDALASVHKGHTVHKDLKPQNIMLERADNGQIQIKLLDFGIARVGADEAAFKTQEGMGGGTPGYWSPEAVSGHAIEYRTDVWGVGVLLFEMLTGDLPWGRPSNQSERQSQIIAMMGAPHPSVNSIRAAKGQPPVVPKVELVIDACLRKLVTDRPTMAEVQKLMKDALEEHAHASGGVVGNAMLTMRSVGVLVDDPNKPRTEARPEAAAAMGAMLARAAEVVGASPVHGVAVAAPTARPRRSSGQILLGLVVVALAVAAGVLFLATRHKPEEAKATAIDQPAPAEPKVPIAVAPASRPQAPPEEVPQAAPPTVERPTHPEAVTTSRQSSKTAHKKHPQGNDHSKNASDNENAPINPFDQ